MRNVLYKKWIPLQRIQKTEISKQDVSGTGCFEVDFGNPGKFHQWSNSFEQLPNGIANYTVAIIETPDGTVEEVLPQNLKFID